MHQLALRLIAKAKASNDPLDEPLRANLIRRGREQAARFSWNWTARQVLEIYQDAARH